MNNNLGNKTCPICQISGSLVFAHDEGEIQCQLCGSRFRVSLPPLMLPPQRGTATHGQVPKPLLTTPPSQRDVAVDFFTQKDVGGNLHRQEVSRYKIESENTTPIEFDPNNPKTAFVLHLLADKARNRRRYNKDITRRYRKKLIDEIELETITDEGV